MATQQEIATHIDLSSRRVRSLVKGGILPTSKGTGGYDLDACRVAYIGYLRGISSGQVNPSSEILKDEEDGNYSFLLEKEKWRKEKRNNDIEEQLVAPVSLLTVALEKTAAQVVPILETLPLLLKRSWPEITGDQVTMVKKAIAECRNAVASAKIDLDCG